MLAISLEPVLLAEPELPKQGRYGGTLRLASYGKPAPLDPFNVTDTISVALLDLVFNKLIRWSGEGDLTGDLARNWMVSKDGLVYTFYLHDNLKFHDAQKCTAEDVAYSFQLFSDKNISPTYYRYFNQVEKWEAVSKSIFRVRLKNPFYPFLLLLPKLCIVPKHILVNVENNLKSFVEHPIGTGPFKFGEWDQSGQITLLANPDYYEDRSYLDRITIVPIEKDLVWPAFLRGEIDMAFHIGLKNFRDIEGDSSFQVFRALSPFGYILIFNFKDPLLQNQKIREALAYAVDRKQLIERLEEGEGVLASGPFHPESWANDPSIEAGPYDPEKAVSLLKEAGFVEKDGVLERNGQPFILKVTLDQKNDSLYRLAKLIRQELHEIGIRTEFTFYSDYLELSKKVYEESDFQSYLTLHHANPEPDVVGEFWHSQAMPSRNVGSYFNPVVESLLNSARKIYDQKERQAIFHQVHRLIEEDKPAIFLYFPYDFFAASRRIEVPDHLFSSVIMSYILKDVSISDGSNKERR